MTMNSRVCIVRQAIYPYDLLVRREAETLQQAGAETHVICLEDPAKGNAGQQNEIINNVFVHRIPVIRKKTSIARYLYDYLAFAFLAAIKLTTLHIKQPFKVIQVNTMPDFLVFSTIIPKLMGAKVISMMYEPTPELWEDRYRRKPPRVLKIAEQLVLAYVDKSFAVTQQLKDTYVARGADANKIGVILNVPDASFLELKSNQSAGTPDQNCFVLICHGAIEERYGLDTIVDSVVHVKPQIPNLRVKILGKGTYVPEILAKIKSLGLGDCVEYLGYVPLEQMIRELRSADVGIVAQKSSPYSNLVHTGKMYDYITLGKPVLASRLRAVEAYFGQDALRYFEPGDPQSLAEGIIDLYQHPDKRETLAKAAQSLYAGYKWDKQKEIYLSTYQGFLN